MKPPDEQRGGLQAPDLSTSIAASLLAISISLIISAFTDNRDERDAILDRVLEAREEYQKEIRELRERVLELEFERTRRRKHH